MDPLSDILLLLKPRHCLSGGLDAGGAWCFGFDQDDAIRCFAVMSGHCWLSVEGVPDPVKLDTEDCVILPHGRAFRIASDLALTPVHLLTYIAAPLSGRINSWNGGGGCFALSALFAFNGDHARMLLEGLPPIVHIRKESNRADLRWCMERLMKELREPRPGGFLLGQYLAHMMLVEALRLYMTEGSRAGVGWLSALADRQMRAALTCMHSDPAHGWTLQELAQQVGMSRSIFCSRFKETVGATPMEYLTRWRMVLAGDRLTHSDDSISTVALSLGYDSESAFSKAFKRVMGLSPRAFSRPGDQRLSSPEVGSLMPTINHS